MSYLQRPPISVNATAGCNERLPMVAYATERLLRASTTLRPYAGALIRHAFDARAAAELDLQAGDTLDVIEAVNGVMLPWWEKHPSADDHECPPLSFITDNTNDMGAHYDQSCSVDNKKCVVNINAGPITALLVAESSVEYDLAVCQKNVFNWLAAQRYQKYVRAEGAKQFRTKENVFFSRRVDSITAHAGDLVLFTNLPPTRHTATGLDSESRRLIFKAPLLNRPKTKND